MTLRRALPGAVATLMALAALFIEAPRNTARADDSSLCLGTSGTLCRTVQVQTCIEWALGSFTASLTGGGMSTTCKTWYTQTWSYYYPTGNTDGGSVTKPGLT